MSCLLPFYEMALQIRGYRYRATLFRNRSVEKIDKKKAFLFHKQEQMIQGAFQNVRNKKSYKKLWKLLIDKDMTAVDLRLATGIAPNTMTKLRRDEEVSLSVLVKICTVLNANIGDIMDLVPEEVKI